MMQYPYYLWTLYNPYYRPFSSYPAAINPSSFWGNNGFIDLGHRKEQQNLNFTNWQYNLGHGFPQYWNAFRPWGNCSSNTGWYNCTPQMYQMTNQWQMYNQNGHYGYSFYWPTMQYFRNPMILPIYTWPRQEWGIQQSFNTHNDDNVETSNKPCIEVAKVLADTPSEVIRNFHIPAQVARKTVSDIPFSRDCHVSTDDSSKSSLNEQERPPSPSSFKISETSITQIASSRSFGPSMVYTTESLVQQR